MVGSLPDALFQVGDNLVLFVDFRGGLVRHVPYTFRFVALGEGAAGLFGE